MHPNHEAVASVVWTERSYYKCTPYNMYNTSAVAQFHAQIQVPRPFVGLRGIEDRSRVSCQARSLTGTEESSAARWAEACFAEACFSVLHSMLRVPSCKQWGLMPMVASLDRRPSARQVGRSGLFGDGVLGRERVPSVRGR